MWLEDKTILGDLECAAAADFIPWEKLRGARILVTGATGLIGFSLINVLLYANRTMNLGLCVLALVRDEARARERFAGQLIGADDLKFILGNVETLPAIAGDIDFIVHGASPTASKTFIERPVDVIRTAFIGTDKVLTLARDKSVRGLVYLSSMEMYGFPERGHKVREDEAGALSPLNVRNSYPLGKQICEALCVAYASQYGVPAMIARLTQTFGPGVNYNDARIFAYFGRCVKEKTDIVLKTRGETERSYLYTTDAALAILTILLHGDAGCAYNCADESTYCSIREMAEKVAAEGGIAVRYEVHGKSIAVSAGESAKAAANSGAVTAEASAKAAGYPDTLYMDLDCSKLRALGWKPLGGGLSRMYAKMISTMGE